MKEIRYEDAIGKNNPFLNAMALTLLIDKGRENLLDETYVREALKYVENSDDYVSEKEKIRTTNFEKILIKIAQEMAKLSQIELYRYIRNEINIPHEYTHELSPARKGEIVKKLIEKFFEKSENYVEGLNELYQEEILKIEEFEELTGFNQESLKEILRDFKFKVQDEIEKDDIDYDMGDN